MINPQVVTDSAKQSEQTMNHIKSGESDVLENMLTQIPNNFWSNNNTTPVLVR